MSMTLGLLSQESIDVEVLSGCTQCGTCSAVCPMTDYMEYSPRVLNALRFSGHYDEALRSQAIWDCTSCYACTLYCPKQIPITESIYSLKRAAMSADVYPRRLTTPVLVKAFVHYVRRGGRNSEAWMSLLLYLRTRPLHLVRFAPLGLRMMRLGRLSLRHESIREPAQLRLVLDALGPSGGGRP